MSNNENRRVIAGAFAATALLAGLIFGTPVAQDRKFSAGLGDHRRVDLGDGDCVVFKMESHNHPSYIEPYQGAATGVGGIMRDVLAHQPSMVLGHEIYISAAVVAASTYVIAVGQGAPPLAAGIVAALVGFAIRAGAITLGWKLPGYRRSI